MDSNKVQILGRYYTIKGIDNQEYREKLAQFVDEHMRQIISATGTVDTLKVAILAALNIADGYFKALEQQQRVDQEMERNVEALSEQIQMVLSP